MNTPGKASLPVIKRLPGAAVWADERFVVLP